MPKYVDGFVIPVPKKKLGAYRRMARWGAKTWMKHGALDYYECAGQDLNSPCGISFPKQFKLKKGETVVFAFIVYKSKKDRDRINARVMSDPSMKDFDPKTMPFDADRMVMGGFEVMVERP